ncbi:transglycosylase domain-containing protein [Microbacterium sp. cx-55]|uniref:transglycosylase domain-containing protein n=1 Tax=Microbacterium sp. cx-55 TaxID=2875948 RepID=UPI001CBD2E6C|nr:transglycosylase domain-containing protein [Microbacterium sp. cx-55]MBZ4487995.1 transglycosylase domain-containing protein [Microbacterium sp. cx-55]UGB34599.1 transglycosylase domain-containing protein [Microbacterium sp. cx-55]
MPDTKRTATGVLGGLAGLVGLSAVAAVLITATVTPAIAISGAAASSAITLFDNMPGYLELTEGMEPSTILYKDNEGNDQVLATFYEQNRSPVTFDQVAPVMYDAILSSEDPRYYEHGGVDLIGTSRALLSNLEGGGSTQGGSSISQQYVKNILIQKCEWDAADDAAKQACFTAATNSSGTEGIERKLQEMRYAIQLEQEYSKNDILLGYLNIANFGSVNYGVDAAARYYFNVPASQLSIGQAAILAGVVQNPNTYRIDQPNNEVNGAADGYSLTKKRQEYVLGRMLEDGKITQEQHDAAVAEPITPQITNPTQGCGASVAPYFCQYVVSVVRNDPAFGETADDRQAALRRGGLRVHTTLSLDLQNVATTAMRDQTPTSVDGMDFGAATVNVETNSGRVLAIAQNTDFNESPNPGPGQTSLVYAGDKQFGGSSGFNAGSTFKLFTLVDWLEQGHSVNEVLNGRNRVFPRMTNSCAGDWVNVSNTKIGNFGGVGGYTGTPMQFTAASLNSGFLAMAEKLDLCDIGNVATKMGVTLGDGTPVPMTRAGEVIGSDNVSPLAIAGAYATIANNGVYCQPQAIDLVTDSNGNELPKPQRTCSQVIAPEVAATAAYALRGVMNGGTGGAANTNDGTQLIGKTGTHEQLQTWMVESSTAVTTAAWVGTVQGTANIQARGLQNIRYSLARTIQRTANDIYGGGAFPAPAANLTKTVTTPIPNVVGQTIAAAQAALEDAGFTVSVGPAVDSDQATDIVAAQNPSGSTAGGSTITINPSNGQGGTVPSVSGTVQNAQQQLTSAGFGNVALGTCTVDPQLTGNDTRATATNPAGGTAANRNTQIAIEYAAARC